MSDSVLRVGFGEADITPKVGALMVGSLTPRASIGVADPLLAKALVAESGGRKVAILGGDIVDIARGLADPAIAEASRRTGIPREAITLSGSHTHSGTYALDWFIPGAADPAYVASLPGLMADAIERANAALQPATMSIGRSLVHHGLHHRRVTLKNGLALNTWMRGALDDIDLCPQVLGSAGPIDPELWVVRFDDLKGQMIGVFFNLSLHVNSRFGDRFSADYPGVVAEAMRREFGPRVTTVFAPGACGNVNPTLGGEAHWRELAEFNAEAAVAAAKRAKRVEGPVVVDAARRDVLVPRRDPESQPAGAVERLNWGGGMAYAELFDGWRSKVGQMPEQLSIPVNAVRLGPLGIATNAGELFVEWGLEIKQRSPFPHTVVAELTNDSIGYQPSRSAFEQQAYETLVGPNRVSLEGIQKLVDTAVELLEELWAGRRD